MKRIIVFLFVIFPFYIFSEVVEAKKILNFAEIGNRKKIIEIFKKTSPLSIIQGNILLNELASGIQEKFKTEIELTVFQEKLWEIIEHQEASENKKTLIKEFFSEIFDESIHEKLPSQSLKKLYPLKDLRMFSVGVYLIPPNQINC